MENLVELLGAGVLLQKYDLRVFTGMRICGTLWSNVMILSDV